MLHRFLQRLTPEDVLAKWGESLVASQAEWKQLGVRSGYADEPLFGDAKSRETAKGKKAKKKDHLLLLLQRNLSLHLLFRHTLVYL